MKQNEDDSWIANEQTGFFGPDDKIRKGDLIMKKREILDKLTDWECPECGAGMEFNDKQDINVENWSCTECGKRWRLYWSVADFEEIKES